MITSLIVAASPGDVIGASGALPWYLPEDLRRFRSMTLGHVVVMGRATHDSIVARLGHPLAGRTSVVVSRTAGDRGAQVSCETSVAAALETAAGLAAAAGNREFFVIGCASVFLQALPSVDRIYLTRIHHAVYGDRAMPAGWLAGFELRRSQQPETGPETGPGIAYSFLDYHRAGP